MSKVTARRLLKMKEAGEKITMVTAYDYHGARLADEAGVEAILVGDSLGMVVLGYETTLEVTMEQMLHHTAAVARGSKNALVIADMPFLSYQITPEEALRNAGRLIQAGAGAVKLEGGREVTVAVKKITEAGIPVMGHLGFTPQSIHKIGGYFVQGKTSADAINLLEDALALQEAGVFSLVLELTPWELAAAITRELAIPTIGIGSGPECDGQVQVFHDLFGLAGDFQPRHAKQYADVGGIVSEGFRSYIREVKAGVFPGEDQSRRMAPEELAAFQEALEKRGK
jgi:3-methyl-2-oxobutanoate hydroxymethyltransferase